MITYNLSNGDTISFPVIPVPQELSSLTFENVKEITSNYKSPCSFAEKQPMLMKVIFNNKEYYLFPQYKDLIDVKEEDYRLCKVGFRDKYIKNMVDRLNNNEIDLNEFYNLNTNDALNKLMEIIKDKNISKVVLGLPKNMDNSLGFAAQRSLNFKKIL